VITSSSDSQWFRLFKGTRLITSPAFIVMKAANAFKDKTTAPNQMWQTDLTYFKIIGWGLVYLSTILTTSRDTSSPGSFAPP